jgi:UDP-2,3-diacylglucosamine pyrophosphatase LpxH
LKRRQIDVALISDVHLGTYGCHAKELVAYLSSIHPRLLILNGDIVDGWQFKKRYFPPSHFAVIKEIMNMISQDVRVIYITGNHDEVLRKYSYMEIGNLVLADKFTFEVDHKKVWVFHGDVFDYTTQGSARLLAKLGGKGYDLLIVINRLVNKILAKLNRKKIPLSRKVKDSVKSAAKFINNFEETIAELAIDNHYDYVICGHIHQPCRKEFVNARGRTTYLNSGDWVENLTALEYAGGRWELFRYAESGLQENPPAAGTKATKVVSEEIDLIFFGGIY